QLSGTVPESPFGFDAVQVKRVGPPWSIVNLMLVRVRLGFTPVQLAFGQPACAPVTIVGADSVAGFVVKVRFPFLMSPLGIVVGVVAGPTRTLFWPGAI